MIGPEKFEATGYFPYSPQVRDIELTVSRALRSMLGKYKCQEWTSEEVEGMTAITQKVYVLPESYMRAFIEAAEGGKPSLDIQSVIRRIREGGDVD